MSGAVPAFLNNGVQMNGPTAIHNPGEVYSSNGVDGGDFQATHEIIERTNWFAALKVAQQGNVVQLPPGNITSWVVTTDVYCGMAGLMYKSDDFNRLSFLAIHWDNNHIPKNVRIIIKQGGIGGTVLSSTRVALPLPTSDTSGQNSGFQMTTVTIDLNKTIPGAVANTYWIEAYFDGYASFEHTNTVNGTSQTLMYVTHANPNYLTDVVNNNFSGDFRYLNITTSLNSVLSVVEIGAETGMKQLPNINSATVNQNSAYGWPLGNNFPSNVVGGEIHAMAIDIQCPNMAVNPPTKMRFIVRSGGSTAPTSNPLAGTVLVDVTVLIDMAKATSGRPFEISTGILQSPIVSTDYLWFEAIADGQFGFRGSNVVKSYGGHNHCIATPTVPALTNEPATEAGANIGVWVKLFRYSRNAMSISPVIGTPVHTQLIAAQQDYLLSDLRAVASSMLPKIYWLSGLPLEIYFDGFLSVGMDVNNYQFDVTTTPGTLADTSHPARLFKGSWQYTPIDADAGNITWTCTISQNGTPLATIATTIVVRPVSYGSNAAIQYFSFGDSRDAAPSVAKCQIAGMLAAKYPNFSIMFRGEQPATGRDSLGNSHNVLTDSPSGATFKFHLTDPASSLCKHTGIAITGGSPSPGATTFTLASIPEIVVGTWITLTDGTPGTKRELIKVSAINGTTITPTTPIVNSGLTNAYYAAFGLYCTANGYTPAAGDVVMFKLGTNDSEQPLNDQALYGSMGFIKDLAQVNGINNMLAKQSGLKIFFGLTAGIPDQDMVAAGGQLATYQSSGRFKRQLQIFRQGMMNWFPGQSQVSLAPLNLGLDVKRNYPFKAYAWNALKPIPTFTVPASPTITIAAGSAYPTSFDGTTGAIYVPGAKKNSAWEVGPPQTLPWGIIPRAHCPADHHLQFVFYNVSGGSIVLPANDIYTAFSDSYPIAWLGDNSIHEDEPGNQQIGNAELATILGSR